MELKINHHLWILKKAGIKDEHEAKREAGRLFIFYKSAAVRRDKNGTFAIFTRGGNEYERTFEGIRIHKGNTDNA